ncbi:NAD(P)-dependent dehydrogenase, short-chain alcohol dehydrogenase family [Cognatiyoonia koreensis]|uniref:NAD(P)-dependent dehydrogenase, short-chain alcohol dehydrogenase family n=1 Tax=Cognatiyoonia koreensis TaxID=364200 RepID=A0A1I0MRQ8_9RHOB|nr:SDR family oxidoreductase [Cognatiyoonia koreensis]SEV91316.1 NAD(P)-dependent dehydrogenase, short-chain alcohol dehydrogenase family [Cognatiyoonia koreensis]
MTSQKTAIVTGGLSGMGLATVKRLHRDGMTVVVGARRGGDPDAIKTLHADVGAAIEIAVLDVRDSDSVAGFVDRVIADHGSVDILVNTAGVYEEAAVIDHPDKIWDDHIDTNLTGTFKMIRAVMPGMVARKWGRIVNLASVAAHNGMPNNAAYCASKAGLLGLGRCVSLEGAPHGVTCVSISPTWVETEMLKRFVDMETAESGEPRAVIQAKYEASNPQGALVQPDEIADLIAFLTSDAGRAITMEDIQVNAGSLW